MIIIINGAGLLITLMQCKLYVRINEHYNYLTLLSFKYSFCRCYSDHVSTCKRVFINYPVCINFYNNKKIAT